MENTILLLKENHIDFFAENLDDAFDFKEIIKNKVAGALVEAFDEKGAKITLNFSNVRVSQYIPDEYKDEIHAILDDIVDDDGDYKESVEIAINLLNQLSEKIEMKPLVKSILQSLLSLIEAALIMALENKGD